MDFPFVWTIILSLLTLPWKAFFAQRDLSSFTQLPYFLTSSFCKHVPSVNQGSSPAAPKRDAAESL